MRRSSSYATARPVQATPARSVVITRDIRYELRITLDSAEQIPPTVELQDMQIVNDSGPQIFIEQEKAA